MTERLHFQFQTDSGQGLAEAGGNLEDGATCKKKAGMCEGKARQETQVADSTSHYNPGPAENATIQSC